VWRLDRLGRSLIDVLNTVNRLRERGDQVRSVTSRAPRQSPQSNASPEAIFGSSSGYPLKITRVLKISQLETITDDVIEAAASILVIGN
jgi:hypothetical protein